MASDFHGDLANIHDEDLLRRMWQQAEDFGLKKEIRTHMYKLREERLREFYTFSEMDSPGFGSTKTPMTPSHGESLADQSFQSLKAKEIRDSESPSREYQVSRMGAMVPDTSGWNISTTSEVSPDGRARKTESTATTEGVQQLPSGHSEFAGKNKHVSKISHQGDDQNYLKSADESSATQFHERSVVGDENNGRIETKSSKSTSSSHVSTSKYSSTTEGVPRAFPDRIQIAHEIDDMLDSSRSNAIYQQEVLRQKQQQQRLQNETNQRIHNERYQTDDTSNTRILTNRQEDNLDSKNIQKEVDLLAAQPGILISRSVDYPDPNTKVITETKQLPDGTTVTTRKYETKSASSKTFRSTSNQQQNTSSRTIVEDHLQRNRIERITDKEAQRIKQEREQQLRDQTNRKIDDTSINQTVHKTTRSENVTNDQTTSRRSSVQKYENIENVKNQVENVFLDKNIHSTVKKDLSQKYRNQEFINNERGDKPKPESGGPIHVSNDSHIERITTTRETDHIVRETEQPMPAAGKPSYNFPRQAPHQPSSTTPERSTPIRDSRTSPFSERPYQQPPGHQVPIDMSDYPKENKPVDVISRPSNQQPKSYDNTPQPTPAAGKPSYNVQHPAGKPSYNNSVLKTQKTETSEQIKEFHEIHVQRSKQSPEIDTPRECLPHFPNNDTPNKRVPGSTDREVNRYTKADYPYGSTDKEPYYPEQPKQYTDNRRPPADNTDHKTTTITSTSVRRTDQPNEREPVYLSDTQRKLTEPRQEFTNSQPTGRYHPITRPEQPDYHKPTTSAREPPYSEQPYPNGPNHLAREYGPQRPASYTLTEHEPGRPAGKPSYTAPRHTNSTPEHSADREIPQEHIKSQVPRNMLPKEPKFEPYEDKEPHQHQTRPEYVRKPSIESHMSTDTVRTNATYNTNKISVEVDAAHDTFARSLRCVSPSERGSVRSLRTSTTSVRSTPSPEKRSPRGRKTYRSPSRDSIPYSESSRISSSTVTKVNTDTLADTRRSPRKHSDAMAPTDKVSSQTVETTDSRLPNSTKKRLLKDQPMQKQPSSHSPDVYKPNQGINANPPRKNSALHVTTVVKQIDQYPGEKKNPPTLSPTVKPKATQASPKLNTRPSGHTIDTQKVTVIKKALVVKPSQRQPNNHSLVTPRGKIVTTFRTAPVTPDKLVTKTSSVTAKDLKNTPQQIEHRPRPRPDAAKASRSPHSSPERSARPEQQPRRNSPSDATDIPYKRTPGSSKKTIVTTRVDTLITRQDKPSSRKPQRNAPAGSDDEGFEPESPRSSSPTSSVSDLVYQKGAPNEPTTERPATNPKPKSDPFIDKEREEIVINDSTFDRRVHRKISPSPERHYPRRGSEPSDGQEETESYYARDGSPNRELPYDSLPSENNYRSNKPHKTQPSTCPQTGPGPNQPLLRDHTPGEEIDDSTDDQKPREPFYLIEPRPHVDDNRSKPVDSRKTKEHPPLVRSETYEERCRKILGMDRREDSTDDSKGRHPRAQSPIRGVNDFIQTEQTNEERHRTSLKPRYPQHNEMHSDEEIVQVPTKPYEPSQKKYPRDHDNGISPDEDNEYYTRVITKTTKSTVHKQPVSDSPGKLSSKGQKEYPKRKTSPETSPNRGYPARNEAKVSERQHYSRKPSTSPTRKLPSISPEVSPTRKSDNTRIKATHQKTPIESTDSSKPQPNDDGSMPRSQVRPDRKRVPESSPSRRPTEISTTRQRPEKSPQRKISEPKEPSKNAPNSKSARKPGMNSHGREPEIEPNRKPVSGGHSRKSPTSSPTRQPENKPYGTRPGEGSITTRERTTPSRKTPVASPISHQKPKSYVHSPDTSPTRYNSAYPKRSPSSSPSRKPCEEPAIGSKRQPMKTRQSPPRSFDKPSKMTSPDRRETSLSPTRKPEMVSHRKPNASSPTRSISDSRSPSRSPARNYPKDLPEDRLDMSTTSRRPQAKPSSRSPARSSDRSPSPVKYTETVTIVTTTTTKEKSPKPKTKKRPEGPNTHPSHIATAKINLSPPSERKPSSSEIKKSPKTAQPAQVQVPKITREVTVTSKMPKSTVPRTTACQKPSEKVIATTTKTISSKISRNEAEIVSRKKPEEENPEIESEPEKDDSDVYSDIEDVSTVIEATTSRPKTTGDTEQPSRRYPLTVRKESAPVYRTTNVEKDKMIRSTSENVIKAHEYRPKEETDYQSPEQSHRRKSLDKKRPIKCMATKTITLNDRLINSEDMEDVIIDIQLAKSSREPSPNRLVPTPVRPGENVPALRYPDNVQEPEEEARRRPKVKDIPILEEGTNDYIRCHISEVQEVGEKVEKRKIIRHRDDEEELTESVTSVRKQQRRRDNSPEYETAETRSPEPDDDFRLSVHDKVAKFITTAEEVSKPKPSAPFERQVHPDDVEPDDCLLSVNEKVNKFLTTTDSVSKHSRIIDAQKRPQRPDVDDLDEDLRNDESILSVSEKVNKFKTTIDKLGEETPQQSPKLVAKIERQVSRKDEVPKYSDSEPSDSVEPREVLLPVKNNVRQRYNPDSPTLAAKPSSPKAIIPKSAEVVKKAKSVFENTDVSRPKQRDIVTRPSVWDHKRPVKDVRLQDIGVQKPFDDETEEIIKRERSRSRSPGESEDEPMQNKVTKVHKTIDVSKNSVSSKKNLFESQVTNKSTTKTTNIRRKSQETIAPYTPRASRQRQPEDSLPKGFTGRTKVVAKRLPNGVDDDEEYIEEITETTTKTMRTEKRSPSRHQEHFSPERGTSLTQSREASPQRIVTDKAKKPVPNTPQGKPKPSPASKTDQHDYPATFSKYSKRPEIPQDLIKPNQKVDQTQAPIYRKPFEAPSVKGYPSKNQEPTHPSSYRPSYMEPTVSSLEHRRDSAETGRLPLRQGSLLGRELSDMSREYSQDGLDSPIPTNHTPSYMEHTISSMEHRRDSLEIIKTNPRRTSQDSLQMEAQPKSAKFGVELKRTTDLLDTSARRISNASDLPNIEEIFDLEVLERLLETVVGYEHRRRIRAQIRVVKKMIEEETLMRTTSTTTTSKTITRKGSDHSPAKKPDPQLARLTEPNVDRRDAPTKKTSYGQKDTRNSTNEFIESESRHITRHEKKTVQERSDSPQRKNRAPVETRKTNGLPSSKKPNERLEDKPIWATKNILKKATESDRTTVKRTTTTKNSKSILAKDDADSVISSYGIGPTDEDGKPLFGIRALKKKSQQPGETRKVTGRIITESYYSENGAPPVGERKVTVYSNDPEDINDYEEIMDHERRNDDYSIRERTSKDGITSVTRLQKIGKPKNSEVPEIPAIMDEQTDTKVKSVRKGSVKEMSEKLIRRGSSSSTTERTSTSSYPKAGLILRTQNYSSTENDDPFEDSNVEICTTRKQSRTQVVAETDSETEHHRVTKTTKSFLNSKGQKVTGVEDVLDRMRNADNVIEDGDTMEDREARSLLNKFLGASVLMSGVESMVPKSVVTRTVVESPGKHEVKTTRVTKTVTSGGSSSSPVARKTCDIEEIWDEAYLKQLLEQSTNYEERRRIRARIRQIMAEKQACTDIATKVKPDRKIKQQQKTEVTSVKEVVKVEEDVGSETESEYEEVEIIEEVTDDSSAEVEEDDDEEEEEEKPEDEGEDEISESNESNATDKKPVESVSSNVVSTEKLIASQNLQSTVKEKKGNAETNLEESNSEKELDKKQDAKEQSKLIILPLLQGLLQKQNSQPNNTNINTDKKSSSSIEIVSNNSESTGKANPNQNEAMSAKRIDSGGLSVHHVEDSGTESGEDLKFIAAGLRDTLQMHSIQNQNENELITEVTTALNRLEASLREGKDLKLDAKKRNALLTLVARLQTGLISPEKITAPTPAPGQTADGDNELSSPDDGSRKFPRSGHQRFAKRRNRANRHTVGVSREELADARRYIEEMVMMESISNRTTPDSGNVVSPPEYPVQKQNSCGAVLGVTGEEPSTLYRPNQFVPSHLKESITDNNEQMRVQMRERKPKAEPMRQTYHFENAPPQNDISKRPYSQACPADPIQPARAVETIKSTVEEKNFYNKTHHSAEAPTKDSVFSGMRPSAYQPQEAPAEIGKNNRFMNKKIMMKRANTIDIPKPIKYMNEMESDSEAEERGINSTKSIGLRGTVQVTVKNTPKSVVPAFQPKTENDLKFLAFIQKQNPSNGMVWNSGSRNQASNPANNWSNKFGNIKNAFESGQMTISGKPPMPTGVASSARNFWKKAETSQVKANRIPSSPKTPEKTTKPFWGDFHPAESPKIIVPKPIAVNKFSHAPMSAFKPISPIANEKEPVHFQPIPSVQKPIQHANGSFSEPLNRRSPKQMSYASQAPFAYQVSKTNQSPTLPWSARPTAEGRVQNIAFNKFDNRPQRQHSARVQDQTYHERVNGYNRMEQKRASLPNTAQFENEPLSAPQMVQDMMHAAIMKEFPPVTYTSTDYSQPAAFSTYVPEIAVTHTDSLTNPSAEPLILTSDRPFISPYNNSESVDASPNCTQNEVSDSELDTDSITEYKAETKIMRGPVSQQAVTITNRTMRRGDEGKFGKNSKEAKSLLSIMKSIKPTNGGPVTKEGRSYQAPKVQSILPMSEEINRFTGVISPPVQAPGTLQGYNPIYEQPDCKVDPSYVSHAVISQAKPYTPASAPVMQARGPDGQNRRTSNPEPYNHVKTLPNQKHGTDRAANFNDLRNQDVHHTSQVDGKIYQPVLKTPSSQYQSGDKYSSQVQRDEGFERHQQRQLTANMQPIQQETLQIRNRNQQQIVSTSAPTTPEKRAQPFVTASKSQSNPSTPKDEPKMVFKKFGPAQPHHYHPNSYQYPLESTRKYSEPNIKPSLVSEGRIAAYQGTTLVNKFIAPKIVETPSSPRSLEKGEVPSNVIYNNIKREAGYNPNNSIVSKFPVNPLSRSDSWHRLHMSNKASPAHDPAPSAGFQLRRVKSGHSLEVPKMFEAGMRKAEIGEKQRTVAAYFSGEKSPNSLSRNPSQNNIAEAATASTYNVTMKKSSINRVRTSEKASIESYTTETKETKEKDGATVTTTTKVTTRTIAPAPKPVSPFAKFRQLDKQNSQNSPKTPSSPMTPGGTNRGALLFQFTDPALNARAATVKEQLLQWCQMKTKEYENVQITNFSTSWSDGLAFCALIHHFLPDAFDYSKLTPKERRHNFDLAFRIADEKAGVAPLLDVEDMVVMRKPDWKCVFTYVQTIFRRFRNCS